MFAKFIVIFFAILAAAMAVPTPEAKADPKAKPGLFVYSAPLVANPVAYSAAYSAPLTYAAAPVAYSAYPAYSAYSAYSAPYVAAW
ncbi:neuropeptide-like 4 [Euwallacea similis]|uniref:neuropeptide-like 4 n=1 Tax=Euwallacea similis TaxID=1736056 RepID=UPI00344F378C